MAVGKKTCGVDVIFCRQFSTTSFTSCLMKTTQWLEKWPSYRRQLFASLHTPQLLSNFIKRVWMLTSKWSTNIPQYFKVNWVVAFNRFQAKFVWVVPKEIWGHLCSWIINNSLDNLVYIIIISTLTYWLYLKLWGGGGRGAGVVRGLCSVDWISKSLCIKGEGLGKNSAF